MRLKRLSDQVVVITGASSGIGLCTARMAADRGAKVVLAARNGEELQRIAEELHGKGHEALAVPTDVADMRAVEALGEAAIERFGRIDTWVNDAAAPVYGALRDVTLEDQRQLFDITYWGVVHGSLVAVKHLRRGGALINIGSIVSDVAVPLQGVYAAAKHAVKAFTNTLRIELAHDGVPVSVTLIKPAAIDTPFADHARSYLQESPVTPPPRYAPQLVARAILHAAENPTREVYVGGAGRLHVAFGNAFPRLYDIVARKLLYSAQFDERPADADRARRDNLYGPRRDGEERSPLTMGQARETSLFTDMQLHPWRYAAAAGVAAAFLGMVSAGSRPRSLTARIAGR